MTIRETVKTFIATAVPGNKPFDIAQLIIHHPRGLDLTKAQQADLLAFERLMKRFKAHGLMMFNWAGDMTVFRVKDYDQAMNDGVSLSTVTIDVDNHGMQSDGGDPN